MIDIDRVKQRLDAVALSANAASQKAGLGRDYIRDILRGRIKEPSARRLRKLADVLECEPADLLDASGEPAEHFRAEADDRDLALPHALKNARRLVKEKPSRSSFGEPFFELLDSVSDRSLLELSYSAISMFLFDALSDMLDLSDTEAAILLGDQESRSDASFERKAILARGLSLIEKPTFYGLVAIAALWRAVASNTEIEVFRGSEVQDLAAPLLKSSGLAANSGRELIRLALMAAVAKAISADAAAELIVTQRLRDEVKRTPKEAG